ncbi:hypothetical protein WICPIJ_010103 [Wickerhamomyces pijperi]|uniref:Apurinic-apyrimidinic endonuclease 1 n=1 Tax=Wickerhamomyces pijperi TaxID=599730 RepID=A0A9P8PIZ7_WICPI|nr:hypothetical protein WICPIJ_010103 [Wickerhamomyces pijperi]
MPPKKPTAPQFEKILNAKNMKFGAHVGAAGGVSNAVLNARNIGANAFALFLKSPRKWESPMIPTSEVTKFKDLCHEHGYDPQTDILPHGSYFINLGNPSKDKAEKAYGGFLDDLQRCEKLGIGHYNFHPGSSLDGDHDAAIAQLASYINKAISVTENVKIVVENMAGTGNLIGSTLEDLKKVLDLVEDKSRIGFCIDTAHTFASGYELANHGDWDTFLKKFEEMVGLEYLAGIHLNDSKVPCGANRDLHERLGQGFIGLECFRAIANCDKVSGVPIILETPVGTDESLWGHEIKLLEWMQGREADDVELLARAEEEQRIGAGERKKQLAAFAKKQKETEKKEKAKGYRQKRKADVANEGNDILSALKGQRKRPNTAGGATSEATVKEGEEEEEHKCALEEKEEAEEK